MAEKINILVVEPGKTPRPAQVENTLDTFTKIVGGAIEAGCYMPQAVLLVYNGEGREMGLPPNRATPGTRDYIAGTFLLCGIDGPDFASLTPAQQFEFQELFSKPGEFMLVGSEAVCTTPGELAVISCKLWDRMKGGESIVMTKWGGTGPQTDLCGKDIHPVPA